MLPKRPLTISSKSFEEEHATFTPLPSLATSSKVTLDLPLHDSASSPLKPIAYPYNSTSFGSRLRSTLRPRRSSSLIRLAQRRAVHFLLALFIPTLVILLLREHNLHRIRGTMSQNTPPGSSTLAPNVDLQQLRAAYEMQRRREVALERVEVGNAKRALSGFKGAVLGSTDEMVWTPVDEKALRDEVNDMWPEWWGNVDIVGQSPYDFVPKPKAEKKRLLFLTDYTDYLERMNTHTYEIVDAALRHPNIITDVWGPGWAGYDRSIPLSVNIRHRQRRVAHLEQSKAQHNAAVAKSLARNEKGRRKEWWGWLPSQLSTFTPEDTPTEPMLDDWDETEWVLDDCGSLRFDVVWTISDIFEQNDLNVDALDCGSLLVQQLGDCHELRCLTEWYPHANNITLSKYAFELPEVFDHARVKGLFPTWEMGIFGHSPDTGNEWDFYPGSWSDKKYDASMFGFDGSFYPIRTTITDHARTNPSTSIHRHQHPGYTLSTSDEARQYPLETYTKGHELYTNHEALRAEFAKGMREARICVFDSSLERKLIRKYAQALLSGCVIAADIPTEHEEALEKFTIPLKSTWSIGRIQQELDRYLTEPTKLHQMSLDGLVYARQHLTTTHKVDDVIRMAEAHNQGVRGYDFSHSFSLRCRSYWSGDGYKPPWCNVGQYRGLEA